jgi:hypothetical protein
VTASGRLSKIVRRMPAASVCPNKSGPEALGQQRQTTSRNYRRPVSLGMQALRMRRFRTTPLNFLRTKRRPQISLANPRDWKRPIAYGVLPAYDEALQYLMRDSAALKKEAEDLRAAVSKEEAAPDRDENALKRKREKLNVLEVQSEINLPEVRWKVANGMGVQRIVFPVYTCLICCIADMTRPVHRHLVEKRWREEGGLDLLVSVSRLKMRWLL